MIEVKATTLKDVDNRYESKIWIEDDYQRVTEKTLRCGMNQCLQELMECIEDRSAQKPLNETC